MEDVRIFWMWSKDFPHKSHAPKGDCPIPYGAKKWISVRIQKSVAAPVGSHVTLIAAPSVMGEEVPESMLPSYPVEISAKPVTIRLPFDGTYACRVCLLRAHAGRRGGLLGSHDGFGGITA